MNRLDYQYEVESVIKTETKIKQTNTTQQAKFQDQHSFTGKLCKTF